MLVAAPAYAAVSGGASAPGTGNSGSSGAALRQPTHRGHTTRRGRAAGAVPQIVSAHCLGGPAYCPSAHNPHAVFPGGTLLVRGRHLTSGMSVVYPRRAARTSRHGKAGAARHQTINSRLKRSGSSFLAPVPGLASSGKIYIVSTGRPRSQPFGPILVKRIPKPSRGSSGAAGGANSQGSSAAAAVFAGNAMWIWYLSKSDGGNLDTIASRAASAQIKTVYVKSSDGSTNFWSQFTPALVQALHQRNLRVCAWQYVYGTHPAAEAQLGAQAVSDGADCLIIDAEAEYEAKYASAQTYIQTLRGAIGPSFPVALAGFPYVDYHESFPYSVFLGPGGAQLNMPQMYWHEIGTSVDRVFSHTYTENQIYSRPILPLGQTYGGTPPSEIANFRQLAQAYGARGHSFWDWQETTNAGWGALGQSFSSPAPVDTSQDYPPLAQGTKGDQVVWLQEHLATAQQQTPTTGTFDATTAQALRAFQSSRGLPPTGVADPSTWTAVLGLAPVAVDWTAPGR
ncbi:MAG: peptidoglycan-binding domain-containing protein [Solirubrobacteraceae bacterium]